MAPQTRNDTRVLKGVCLHGPDGSAGRSMRDSLTQCLRSVKAACVLSRLWLMHKKQKMCLALWQCAYSASCQVVCADTAVLYVLSDAREMATEKPG